MARLAELRVVRANMQIGGIMNAHHWKTWQPFVAKQVFAFQLRQ